MPYCPISNVEARFCVVMSPSPSSASRSSFHLAYLYSGRGWKTQILIQWAELTSKIGSENSIFWAKSILLLRYLRCGWGGGANGSEGCWSCREFFLRYCAYEVTAWGLSNGVPLSVIGLVGTWEHNFKIDVFTVDIICQTVQFFV